MLVERREVLVSGVELGYAWNEGGSAAQSRLVPHGTEVRDILGQRREKIRMETTFRGKRLQAL